MPPKNDELAIERRIGQRVRKRRFELGLETQFLADKLGVGPAQIVKYESGTAPLSASRLAVIASYLGKPLEYFIDRQTKAEILSAKDDIGPAVILEAYEQASAAEKKQMVDLAMSITDKRDVG